MSDHPTGIDTGQCYISGCQCGKPKHYTQYTTAPCTRCGEWRASRGVPLCQDCQSNDDHQDQVCRPVPGVRPVGHPGGQGVSEDCLDCGHSPHLHVNWVGSCSVYTKGKRCKCGIFRTHDTSPAYAIPFDQWPQPIGQSAGSESVGSQPDPITIKSYDFTHCARCGRSALAAVIDPKNGICTHCITDRATEKKTADREDDMGKRKNTSEKAKWWERLEFVTRNITASMDCTDASVRDLSDRISAQSDKACRLDSELDDLTARMDTREIAAQNLLDRVSAIERANVNATDCLDRTNNEVDVLRETVGKLADSMEKLLDVQESMRSISKTHTLWLERLGKRVGKLEDRLSPPSESSESQEEPEFDFRKYQYEPRPASEIYPDPFDVDRDYWLRYRLADLRAQIAAEEALGRNTGLLRAAKRMVRHFDGEPTPTTPSFDNGRRDD